MSRGKKQTRHRMQTRTKTKTNKYTSLSDAAANNALLSTQLHALGLYAVETLGDGNCLFRALSDQLYGTPSYHFKLRSEICDWITLHKDRYEPFVEDDRGLDIHLKNMREHGTYGGHLELSAFAHLKRRNVKVLQPGLVYVIEWDGGDVLNPTHDVSHRRRKGKAKEFDSDDDKDDDNSSVYIAYHDWEHFSSIRNISGPHQGPPSVREAPQPISSPKAPKTSIKLRIPRPKGLSPATSSPSLDPTTIALPRSPSPSSQDSSHLTSTSTTSLLTSDDSAAVQPSTLRQNRSPKRTFDESEFDDLAAESHRRPYQQDKKLKSDRLHSFIDLDDDPLSDLSSVMSTPAPESEVSTPARALSPLRPAEERPLTRRQRKAMGLPKPRGSTAGRIVIPGGKHPKRQGKGWIIVSEDEEDSSSVAERHEEKEWIKNGTGRVDVRGFKELRI